MEHPYLPLSSSHYKDPPHQELENNRLQLEHAEERYEASIKLFIV